jgi:hypothetical protein
VLSAAAAGCSSILGFALLHEASASTATAAKNRFFFISFSFIFILSLFRSSDISSSQIVSFAHRCPALCAHFAVLVHYAVDAAFLHGLTVVNMLRRKASVFACQHFYEQKSHAYSNY